MYSTINENLRENLVPVTERISIITGIFLSSFGKPSRDIVVSIEDALRTNGIPEKEAEAAVQHFRDIFTKHKRIIPRVYDSIMELFPRQIDLFSDFRDYSGEIYNAITEWVDIPDRAANDVILTPEYVKHLMVDLADIHGDKVLDNAAGTCSLYSGDFIGIEKNLDVYLLGVLNLLLNGKDATRLIHGDGLYDIPEHDVLLLNPPYSYDCNGLVFAEKALKKTKKRAVILVQESAGAGRGNPSARDILRENTLVASVRMADIFNGKAQVQTAIYVFDTGKPHSPEDEVVFIDMSDDGYIRRNRKNGNNLSENDNPKERYKDVADIVSGKEGRFYREGETVFRDTISLNGDDWTVGQHKVVSKIPSEEDFDKTIVEYILYKMRTQLQK